MVNTHWSSKEQQNDQRKERISCKRVNKLGLSDLAKHRWKEGYDSTLYINVKGNTRVGEELFNSVFACRKFV